jgi:hypothetical protein
MPDDEEWDDELPDKSNDPTVVDWDTVDYIRAVCPHNGCSKKNWVYLGPIDDITCPERETMRCWSCGKLSWISRDIRDEYSDLFGTIEDAFEEKGEEKPPSWLT